MPAYIKPSPVKNLIYFHLAVLSTVRGTTAVPTTPSAAWTQGNRWTPDVDPTVGTSFKQESTPG